MNPTGKSGGGRLWQVEGPALETGGDPEGELAFYYEKRGGGARGSACLSRAALVFPRCASVIEVTVAGDASRLDAYGFMVIPPAAPWAWRGVTTVSDLAVLLPSPELIALSRAEYRLEGARLAATFAAVACCARTNWINELMHRYVFERVVARGRDNAATRFLGLEVVKEVYYRVDEAGSARAGRFDLDGRHLDGRSPVLRKAMAFIEANLFAPVTTTAIARHAGASQSTLLRVFQEGLGSTPIAYVAGRRLDEAMALLKTRRYSVTEVSDLVGYESLSAFSAAFRKRFGVRPSELA